MPFVHAWWQLYVIVVSCYVMHRPQVLVSGVSPGQVLACQVQLSKSQCRSEASPTKELGGHSTLRLNELCPVLAGYCLKASGGVPAASVTQ